MSLVQVQQGELTEPVNSTFTGFILFLNMPLGGKIDRLLEKAGIWLLTEKQTVIVLLDKVWLCCLMVNFSFTVRLFLWTYFFFITIFITYFSTGVLRLTIRFMPGKITMWRCHKLNLWKTEEIEIDEFWILYRIESEGQVRQKWMQLWITVLQFRPTSEHWYYRRRGRDGAWLITEAKASTY